MPFPDEPELIEYSQKLSTDGVLDRVYDQVTYSANQSPVLVARSKVFRVLSISGEAIVWGGKLKAPDPALVSYFLGEPKINYERLIQLPFPAWRTTWDYVLAVDDAQWATDADFNAFLLSAEDWPDVATLTFLAG